MPPIGRRARSTVNNRQTTVDKSSRRGIDCVHPNTRTLEETIMPMPGCVKLVSMALLMALATGASAQKTQLLVYTALETDQIKAYQEGFNRAQPDIEIKWVRDST